MATDQCKDRCVHRSLITGQPLISCPPQCWQNYRGPTVYLNLCGQAADYVAPVAPKLRSHYCHCNQDSEHDCKYCGKCSYCCEGNECARTTRYDANDFTSRAAFYRWIMDCSCGCTAGNCPSCFACLACCECHLDRPSLAALEAEWREDLRGAAAERESESESESSKQPEQKKSKSKARRFRKTALARQTKEVLENRVALAESEKKVSEKKGQAVKRQRGAMVRVARETSWHPSMSLTGMRMTSDVHVGCIPS